MSEDNRVYDLDPNSGEMTENDVLDEVSEASAIDALIGHEGEAMLAVADADLPRAKSWLRVRGRRGQNAGDPSRRVPDKVAGRPTHRDASTGT